MGKTLTGVKYNPRNPNSDSVYMTSDFGMRTITLNGKKKTSMHNGVDLTTGDKVYAIYDGTVTNIRSNIKGHDTEHSAGNYIKIKHPNGAISVYYHLKHGTIKINVGDKVTRGQYIADEGATGNVTGPHLHLGIYVNGKWIDPKPYLYGEKTLEEVKVDYTKEKVTKYSKGTYEVISPRYVRTNAGTEYSIKKVRDLTPDGQNHAVDKNKDADAQYMKGTKFTAQSIMYANNKSIWAKTPSGYVCIESSKGTIYCKKVK